MGLETGTKLSDLVAANPTATDVRSAGDDHMRLIKTILKATAQRMIGSGEVESELTIATGAIIPTGGIHSVDTQADAATDDLDTITATNFTQDMFLLLRANHTDRSVVLKHGTGNISLSGAADITLDENTRYILLKYDGANWIDVLYQVVDFYVHDDLIVGDDLTVGGKAAIDEAITMQDSSTAGDPASGYGVFYQKAKGATSALYFKDDAGNVIQISASYESLADAAKTLTMEDGSFHAMIPTAARTVTLPTTDVAAGWEVEIWNDSTDTDITIQPSDAGSSYVLPPKCWVRFKALQAVPTSAGHWLKVGGSSIIASYTASGTFTVPLGVHRVYAELYGGGGGGGGASGTNNNSGAGGGAGGLAKGYLALTPDAAETVTIGSGGAAGVAGTASTFSGLTANGGSAGATGNWTNGSLGGTGGTATGGDLNFTGQSGGTGNNSASGGGPGGGKGGDTLRGAGGKGGARGSAGAAGAGMGAGGGGGGPNAQVGGAGSDGGLIIVY